MPNRDEENDNSNAGGLSEEIREEYEERWTRVARSSECNQLKWSIDFESIIDNWIYIFLSTGSVVHTYKIDEVLLNNQNWIEVVGILTSGLLSMLVPVTSTAN